MSSQYSSSGGGSSGPLQIPEYISDPISPSSQDVWVLRTPLIGTPIGLLLALTYTTDQYQLSYRTLENTTVRTNLS